MLPNINIERNDSSKLEKESKASNVSDKQTFQEQYYSYVPQKKKTIRKHHLSPIKQSMKIIYYSLYLYMNRINQRYFISNILSFMG